MTKKAQEEHQELLARLIVDDRTVALAHELIALATGNFLAAPKDDPRHILLALGLAANALSVTVAAYGKLEEVGCKLVARECVAFGMAQKMILGANSPTDPMKAH